MRSSVLLRPPPVWSTPFAVALAAYGLLVGFAGSFTGLGGGFILVPFLLLLRLPLYQAVGTSFVAVLAISLTALSKHAVNDMIVLDVGLALGVGGIVGSQIGARLVRRISRRRFHKLFSAVLLGLAGYLATDAFLQATGDEPLSPPGGASVEQEQLPRSDGETVGEAEKNVTGGAATTESQAAVDAAPTGDAQAAADVAPGMAEAPPLSPITVNPAVFVGLALVGLFVGIAAAFAGMGGGFLLVPLLLVLGFGVIVAVATAFVAILMIASASLYAHIRQKGVLWRHGLVLAGAGVVGAYLGAAVLQDVSPALFKAVFAALLGVFGGRMAWEGWRPRRRRVPTPPPVAPARTDAEEESSAEIYPSTASPNEAAEVEDEDSPSGSAPDNP